MTMGDGSQLLPPSLVGLVKPLPLAAQPSPPPPDVEQVWDHWCLQSVDTVPQVPLLLIFPAFVIWTHLAVVPTSSKNGGWKAGQQGSQ